MNWESRAERFGSGVDLYSQPPNATAVATSNPKPKIFRIDLSSNPAPSVQY